LKSSKPCLRRSRSHGIVASPAFSRNGAKYCREWRCCDIDADAFLDQETAVYEEATPLRVVRVPTKPIPNQKTGTSGMRKRTLEVAQTPHFLENWLQSLFDVLGHQLGKQALREGTMIVGGDGREWNLVALRKLWRIAAANGLGKLIVLGPDAIATTPAISAVIRATRAIGGIAFTASHNPGGLHGDWGVKYNMGNGGPAPDAFTAQIYERTKSIDRYFQLEATEPDALCGSDGLDGISVKRVNTIYRYHILRDQASDVDHSPSVGASGHRAHESIFEVHLVDATEEYVSLMERIFNFDHIRGLLKRPNFHMVFDAMHASTGPYVFEIFLERLRYSDYPWFRRGQYLPDFGGTHPDPNMENLADLVQEVFSDPDPPEFAAASDADGDRYLIFGKRFVVQPSDSLAVMLDYALNPDFSDYFRGDASPVRGVARSMPTSAAVDRVAEKYGLRCYETPTGWKYFCNLLDAGKISLCGEESCGAGSLHIREKDGLWAVLFWLSILAYCNKDREPEANRIGVEDVVRAHWAKYGRNYYERWDFDGVDRSTAEEWIRDLEQHVESGELLDAAQSDPKLYSADVFHYQDPVDGTWAHNQGVRLFFAPDRSTRAVIRLSGTSSTGATVRVYLEKYVSPHEGNVQYVGKEASNILADIGMATLALTGIPARLGRQQPDLRA
jgi:phosphoglucomutase